MALNIKDKTAEGLAAEVAALTGENKTEAIRVALRERLERLRSAGNRAQRLKRFLEEELWPQLPPGVLGTTITKEEREAILGYGDQGF